jgi:hypothetical protein
MLVDQIGLLSGKQKAPTDIAGASKVGLRLRSVAGMRIRQKTLSLSLVYNTEDAAVAAVGDARNHTFKLRHFLRHFAPWNQKPMSEPGM